MITGILNSCMQVSKTFRMSNSNLNYWLLLHDENKTLAVNMVREIFLNNKLKVTDLNIIKELERNAVENDA